MTPTLRDMASAVDRRGYLNLTEQMNLTRDGHLTPWDAHAVARGEVTPRIFREWARYQ